MTTTEMAPTIAPSMLGTSQFETECGALLTSPNTSPGTAKRLSKRAGKDILRRVSALDGCSSRGGGCFMGSGIRQLGFFKTIVLNIFSGPPRVKNAAIHHYIDTARQALHCPD